MNNLLSMYDLDEFDFRIVKKTIRNQRIVFVDGKFTEADLKSQKRTKKNASKSKDKKTEYCVHEYAKYKFKYLNGSTGRDRAVPFAKETLGEKLKTVKYFLSSPPYANGIMFNYLVPELFTLGVQTSGKVGVIHVQAGEIWLFVKPPTSDRVTVENSLDPSWFKTWGYCRLTKNNPYATINPASQFFFVSVEKSLFLFTYSDDKVGYVSARVTDTEESEEDTCGNETDSSAVITTTTVSDQYHFTTDMFESPVPSQGYENVIYLTPVSNNAVKRHATSSISDEPTVKKITTYIDQQSLETINRLADYIKKKQKEHQKQQEEVSAYLLAQVQQFPSQPRSSSVNNYFETGY
jgi:hypothetical protein